MTVPIRIICESSSHNVELCGDRLERNDRTLIADGPKFSSKLTTIGAYVEDYVDRELPKQFAQKGQLIDSFDRYLW